MTVNAIYGHVYHSILLGAGYSADFKVGSGALVRPGDTNPNFAYTGIASLVQNALLTNYGSVYGSNGVTEAGPGSAGGIGVNLSLSGDTLVNHATIAGGNGGTSLALNGYGNNGGAGGTGVNLISTGATSSNSGAIFGGRGGNDSLGYGAGAGGVGLDLSGGTLNTTGVIEGGQGGYSNGAPFGAAGGVGVEVGAGGVLNNLSGNSESSIRGGAGGEAYRGGQGGVGVSLASGATLQNNSRIVGGAGANSVYSGQDFHAQGGDGGVGLQASTGSTVTLNSSSVITGGVAGDGFVGGNGGAGVTVALGATMSNAGTITGGMGTGPIRYENDTLYSGGNGGAGISITNGFVVNTGSIVGGSVTYGIADGTPGVGVYLNGGTLIDAGSIKGGIGYNAFSGLGGGSAEFRTYAVQFGPKAGTLVVDSTASFDAAYTSSGSIGGFASGDTINIGNMTPTQVMANLSAVQLDHYSGRYYAVLGTPTEGPITIDLSVPKGVSGYGETFSITSNGGTGADITLAAACYLRGTHISTADGERPIEALAIGDLVLTSSGALRPIRWIGRRRYLREVVANDPDLSPVRIHAGALGSGVPRRDLYVSPGHAIYLDGMLLSARDLVNGISILQEPWHDDVSYFHIEFDTHDVIFAEGAPSESFADDDSRRLFDNYAEHLGIHGCTLAGPVRWCAPRIEDGEALEAVRRRLFARAAGVGTCEEARKNRFARAAVRSPPGS